MVGCQDGMGVIVAFRVPEAPGITSGLVYRTEVEVWILEKNFERKKGGIEPVDHLNRCL